MYYQSYKAKRTNVKPDGTCQDAKHHYVPPDVAFSNIHHFKKEVKTQAVLEAQKTDYVFFYSIARTFSITRKFGIAIYAFLKIKHSSLAFIMYRTNEITFLSQRKHVCLTLQMTR